MSMSRIFSSSSCRSRFFSSHGGISSFYHRPTPRSPIPFAFLTKPHSASYFRSHPLFRKQSVSEFSSSAPSNTGFVAWYLRLLEARPILTKAATAGIIFTAADVSSQMITLTPMSSYDPIRTLRMAGYGFLISGPSLHFWFNFVSRILPKRDLLSTLKKMLMGQTIYGPAINATFFSVNAALQGENIPEIVARLKRDLIPTMINGLIYWPMCDFITFKYISVRLQPLIGPMTAVIGPCIAAVHILSPSKRIHLLDNLSKFFVEFTQPVYDSMKFTP